MRILYACLRAYDIIRDDVGLTTLVLYLAQIDRSRGEAGRVHHGTGTTGIPLTLTRLYRSIATIVETT